MKSEITTHILNEKNNYSFCGEPKIAFENLTYHMIKPNNQIGDGDPICYHCLKALFTGHLGLTKALHEN